MSLQVGVRLGPYEVIGILGAGGMGEVYRARDTRLKRDVALKILPESFSDNPERLARFQREAEVLASLNHPHIAGIHGIEESGATRALVLELVEGETLADLIRRGPIAVDEALPIARQIAEALEAAHEQGVIHRDLKPSNIKVTPDGVVKVLDLGLAKLVDAHPGSRGVALELGVTASPTITSPAMMTGLGTLLGTAAYMAPEQARGRPVDKRADIWAFGCVLYEMLTATRAFGGDNVSDIIAAVVKSEPDWSALPPDVPATLRLYLRRCLEKNPRDRIHDIGDARLALEGAFDVPATLRHGSEVLRTKASWRARGVVASSVAALLVLGGVAAWTLKPETPERPLAIRRYTLSTAPVGLGIANRNRDIAITPDGSRVVYFAGPSAARQLYVRDLDALEGTPIRPADRFYEPFLSADSRWVGFIDESTYTLQKMPLSGGPPVPIAQIGREMLGATWRQDDTIVFAGAGTGLWRVPAGGGTPAALTTPDKTRGEVQHSWPEFLPGGNVVLYTIQSGERADEFRIAALNIASGETKILVESGSSPRFSPSGHLVYAVRNTIRAVPFDPLRLEVLGGPVSVLEGVLTKTSGGADFSVSADGTLVYATGTASAAHRPLVWAERGGTRQAIDAPPHAYFSVRLSPDGTRAALWATDALNDLWIWDFARKTATRLTDDPGVDGAPVWTPDGRRIVFFSGRRGASNYNLFVQAADATGPVERWTDAPNTQWPTGFSPDGSRLIFHEDGGQTGQDLRMLILDGERRNVPLVQTASNERNGQLSPDGKWLAYQSNVSGQDEVYVQPFPDIATGRWQISTTGGDHPVWARDGRELFYVAAAGRLMAVDVRTQRTFAAGTPRIIIDGGFFASNASYSYDVSLDGRRFLLIEPSTATQSDSVGLSVVLNWGEELKRLVPVN